MLLESRRRLRSRLCANFLRLPKSTAPSSEASQDIISLRRLSGRHQRMREPLHPAYQYETYRFQWARIV